jgi:hypothetical protein
LDQAFDVSNLKDQLPEVDSEAGKCVPLMDEVHAELEGSPENGTFEALGENRQAILA